MFENPVINIALLVLLLPLAAFVIQIFFGKRMSNGGMISVLAISASFIGAFAIMRHALIARSPDWGYRWVFDWFTIGAQPWQVGVLVDNVTAVMLVVVTGVSALVHIYSTSYMHGDPKYSRFFAFLSLFSFSMLGLVLCDNLFFLYCFWELVGLSSYFLIGFWSERQPPADAAKKAFLVNRVGDIGFFLGIMILWTQLGTFGYHEIFGAVAQGQMAGTVSICGIEFSLLTLAGLCLFCGAVGKSAQFPLHVWLPDAMEGPTPVSALIHAATMVAAGVYMVGRLYPLFTPAALTVIAYTGCITAFFAGTIAIAATDIKRVLAYSTVSQLGYMVMGLGVGGYTAGLFHLMTHAWFKACLFLGSGSVIHGLHTQEMPEMGGLRKKMPWTFLTMLVATMALCGVPPLSGFFSKDAILAAVLQFGFDHPQHLGLFLLAAVGAGITTFYMFRLIFLTFFGEPRDHHKFDHAHESDWKIVMPLVILAGLSVSAGWGSWFETMVQKPTLEQFSPPSVAAVVGEDAPHLGHGDAAHAAAGHHGGHGAAHYIAMLVSIAAVAAGFALSFIVYFKRSVPAETLAARFPNTYRWLKNKYYVDEFYAAYVVKPLLDFEEFLARFDLRVIDGFVNWVASAMVVVSEIAGRIDLYVVDGLLNWMAEATLALGQQVRRLQAGRIQEYLLVGFTLTVIFVLTISLLP